MEMMHEHLFEAGWTGTGRRAGAGARLLQRFSGVQSGTVMSYGRCHMGDAPGFEQCRDLIVEHKLPMLALEVWLSILVLFLKQQYFYNSRNGGTVIFIQLDRGGSQVRKQDPPNQQFSVPTAQKNHLGCGSGTSLPEP